MTDTGETAITGVPGTEISSGTDDGAGTTASRSSSDSCDNARPFALC